MQNNKLIIGTSVIILILLGILYNINRPKPDQNPNQEQTQDQNGEQTNTSKPKEESNQTINNQKPVENNSNELKKEILKQGNGAVAKAGDTVEVHYTGWLTDGTKFDSSIDRGQPFSFHLGAGEVIKGWDDGVSGMKVGEKVKLTIPYSMAYGENGYPPVIPAKATLIFEVELLKIN